MRSAWDPDKEEYAELLSEYPSFRLDQLWNGLYQEAKPISDISVLPNAIRTQLAETIGNGLTVSQIQESENSDTIKWLWNLNDGKQIETVLMHYDKRSTVCVSSQAGCAMGCGFCATGQAGYERHLSVGEICEQVAMAQAAAASAGRRVTNIVFMGMGEPLANYKNVVGAIKRLNTDFGIGARNIVVSTVGLVPQIKKLATEGIQFSLAISIHSANDADRDVLVPINKRHNLADLVDAGKYFFDKTGRRISIEWAMMADANDTDKDANELAAIAKQMNAHVNLIPLNPTPGWPTVGSSADKIDHFVRILKNSGVNVTVRKNRGTDIDAACGQLRATSVDITKQS